MIINLKKEFRFEASHQLPHHDGKCAQLHGHSWVLQVWIRDLVNQEKDHPKEGMAMDYAQIKEVVENITLQLDHHHLGSGLVWAGEWGATISEVSLGPDPHLKDFPPVPTSENILYWIAKQLPKDFPWFVLALNETCTTEARLFRNENILEFPYER